jgi:pimeloyl-ACP methyl ester carboxylesterase
MGSGGGPAYARRVSGRGALRLLRGGVAPAGGETVVLLHGRGHAAPVWFPCWPALAARHALLAIDLPGFGQSSAPALSAGRRLDAEAALAAFVDPIEACLAAEVAAGRAPGLALVGHSLGGLVALELALRARLPVRRLVLIDAMGLGPAMTGAGRIFFRLHPERLLRWLGPRLFGRLNPSPPTPLGRRVAALELELLAAPTAAPARAAAARAFDALCPLWGPVFHRRARLGEIASPVFLLWGARDAALPPALGPAACAELRAAQSLILPQGHSPHLDAPDQALPPLLDFLAAGAPRG